LTRPYRKLFSEQLMRPVLAIAFLLTTACATSAPRSGDAASTQATADSVTWRAGTPLPSGRDHHVTFITGAGSSANLWVVGGNDYKSTMADAWRAPISADGSLGAWVAGPRLPGQRAGMGVAANDRFVILTGGKDSAQRTVTDIFSAPIASDGTLGEWKPAGILPAPRFHHATLVDGRYIYVVGGLEKSVSVPAVLRGTIANDGTISRWDSVTPLPRPRSHQSMFVHDRALYLVGGLDGNPAGANTPLKDVIRASIRSDGTLGSWEEVSTMDHAYATHATAVFGGALWLLGGVEDNARFVDVVLRAPFAADGKLGPWKQLAVGLPAARSHVHQVPVFQNRIYSAAGSNRRVVTPDVQVGTFVSF
jgi:hypothetical protein